MVGQEELPHYFSSTHFHLFEELCANKELPMTERYCPLPSEYYEHLKVLMVIYSIHSHLNCIKRKVQNVK